MKTRRITRRSLLPERAGAADELAMLGSMREEFSRGARPAARVVVEGGLSAGRASRAPTARSDLISTGMARCWSTPARPTGTATFRVD